MAIANDNYPDIVQHGDAFAVREESWKPPQTRSVCEEKLMSVLTPLGLREVDDDQT